VASNIIFWWMTPDPVIEPRGSGSPFRRKMNLRFTDIGCLAEKPEFIVLRVI
jgi:hypothetical protein